MRGNNIELLAPAGSYESLKAAVFAGADAIYVGGNQFGARAYANNFTEQELLDAIDFAHLHRRKIYLTVNTLLKDTEIFEELHAYLRPLYEQGLDAVIVQDIGVLSFIREHFVDLPIHASTQMTIANSQGVHFLQEQGVSRVVLARELLLQEVSQIIEDTDMEVECFVHGALCYSYSGQCLFSSFIGGRSGNRGQCAGPCRLPYQVGDTAKAKHIFSLKDICNVQHIPELIESGIHSFKIEGRMKRPEYVAAVVSIYRRYIDLYLEGQGKDYKVSEADMDTLMEAYNRGGFHSGYLHQHNGRDMLSLTRPNHAGLPVMKVESKGRVRLLRAVHPGDVLDMPAGRREYTLGQGLDAGETMHFQALQEAKIKQGTQIARMRNENLLLQLRKEYIDTEIKEKIKGKFMLSFGKSATLFLSLEDVCVEVKGNIVEKAKSSPTTYEEVRKQVSQLGNTPFEWEDLQIQIEPEVFVPMKSVKALRREGIAQLTDMILRKSRRVSPVYEAPKAVKKKETQGEAARLYVLVETAQQLEVAFDCKEIERIYMDLSLLEAAKQQVFHRKSEKELYLAMPFVFRANTHKLFKRRYQDILEFFDGVLFRNYDSYAFLKRREYPNKLVTDFFVYNVNQSSRRFWQEAGVEHITTSLEMNGHELKDIAGTPVEMVVYGYLPMMVSAGCVKKNTQTCDHISEELFVKDRYKKEFLVKNYCEYCYNIVYNFAPLWLCDKMDKLKHISIKAMRLQFVHEDEKEMREILNTYIDAHATGRKVKCSQAFTRGHFERGIR